MQQGTPAAREQSPPSPDVEDILTPDPRFPYGREMVAGGVLIALLIVVVRLATAPLSNTDTYFHLRFGEEFLDGWSLHHPGSVSSFATADWLPTQWLSEIVMAQDERWFGLAGVAWLYGVILVALVGTLYLSARRWCGPLLAVGLTFLALLSCTQQLGMRPQLLSFLLIAVTMTAWLRTRDDGRIRWWLVPMTWVWAMAHGMWPIGIGLGVVAVVAMGLDRSLDGRRLRRAALVPVLSAVVTALTPVGPALYDAMLAVNSRAQFFSEWNSPSFNTVSGRALALMLLTGVGVVLWHGNRRWLDLALLLIAAMCAVWSWRTVPAAAMILVPLVAVQRATLRGATPTPGRPERLLLGLAGVVTLAAIAVIVPHTADKPPSQPAWVEPALSQLPAGTKVVDSWDWGGYLMWRYPQLDLLMHGYGDTFTVAELQRNTDIADMSPGWDMELRETGCTYAVLRPTGLAYALEHQLHWKILHRSSDIVELRAPTDWLNSR